MGDRDGDRRRAGSPLGSAAGAEGRLEPQSEETERRIPWREALGTWLRIGCLGFGGPAGQIALMHRILVEEKRWIGEARFLHALQYCMLLPGPEAQQLATYVGWLLHRTAGGLAAGVLFVLPGALVVLGLSILYARYQSLAWVAALFAGLKPAVLAVVIEAVLRIGRRALRTRFQLALAALAFLATFLLHVPFPAIVLGAGLLGFVVARLHPASLPGPAAAAAAGEGVADLAVSAPHTRPSRARALRTLAVWSTLWAVPVAGLQLWLGPDAVFSRIALFFSQAAVVTFGGAYAVLAYLAQAAVSTYGWLAPGEMLDGLGLAETTPGPLILVTQFVGFLAAYRQPGGLDPLSAGVLAAALTTWVTFVPCFLWILLGAPYMEALRGRRSLDAALGAILAAVVGVILNLAIWFALHVVFRSLTSVRFGPVAPLVPDLASVDLVALAISGAALLAMLRFHVGMLPTLAASAGLGGILRWIGAAS
jgi:chromate transporter